MPDSLDCKIRLEAEDDIHFPSVITIEDWDAIPKYGSNTRPRVRITPPTVGGPFTLDAEEFVRAARAVWEAVRPMGGNDAG